LTDFSSELIFLEKLIIFDCSSHRQLFKKIIFFVLFIILQTLKIAAEGINFFFVLHFYKKVKTALAAILSAAIFF